MDLVNLHTMTHTSSYPFLVWRNPTMKSIIILSHFHLGISKTIVSHQVFGVKHWYFGKSNTLPRTIQSCASYFSTKSFFEDIYASSSFIGAQCILNHVPHSRSSPWDYSTAKPRYYSEIRFPCVHRWSTHSMASRLLAVIAHLP